MAYGMNGHIGLAKESSGGTAVAATDYHEALSEDLTATLDRFQPINIHSGFHEADDAAGVKRLAGSIVLPTFPEILGFYLDGAMGVQSNNLVVSGELHKHSFTMRTSDWDTKYPQQPYTFEINRDVTSSQQYAGCNIAQLEFNVAPNQELRATAQILGTAEDDIDGTTPTFTSSPTAPFTFDTASISVGGAGNDRIEGLTLTINNNLEGVPTLNNSTNINKIRRTDMQMVRLSGTISFEDIVEYNNFLNQTEQAVLISLFKASSFQIIFDLPRFVYTAFPLGMPGRERLTVGFEGMARYHTGSNEAIQIDLHNTTSGY